MQPELPQLPPIQPPSAPAPMPTAPAANHSKSKSVSVNGQRLRQIIGVVAGGSFGLIVMAGIGEVVLRPELKPTTWLATFEAQTDLGIINQKMGVKPGAVVMTEAEYREKLANAERSGQAKAELAFQRQMAVVQADKERIVGAYQTLYQRTNIIAQAGVQMEAQALQFRQRLIEQTNGGRAMVISVYDTFCALGDANSCDAARNARSNMVEESGSLTEGDVARKVQELMAGIPDPASLVVDRDLHDDGPPRLPHR